MKLVNKIRALHHNYLALILLIISGIYLLTVALISKGIYGDADSITHFEIARYSFRHPQLFLNHWGKPLFTILSAPFAQFGLDGAIFFNILCGLATSWLIYQLVTGLNVRSAWLAIPFVLFAPVYMINLFTSLTEILFGLVLVLSIYLFFRKKFIFSAIIISFLPFARTEGIIFLFLFLTAYIFLKNWKAIPFLLTGILFFSIAGMFMGKSTGWLITEIPYGEKGSEIYGSGSFWYYFKHLPSLLGLPIAILAGVGLFKLFIQKPKKSKAVPVIQQTTLFLLIAGSFFAFLLAHSFLWWQGMMGVIASKRFIAGISPLSGIFALIGLNFLFSCFPHSLPRIKPILTSLLLALILYIPYRTYRIPARLELDNQVLQMTADELLKRGYSTEQVTYFDPKIPFFLNSDPFDENGTRRLAANQNIPFYGLKDSSVLVWEPHFGGFERKIFLEDLWADTGLTMVDAFLPDEPYQVYKDQNYMTVLFKKIPPGSLKTEWNSLDSTGFEQILETEKMPFRTDSISGRGNYSFKMNSSQVYSPSVKWNLTEIKGTDKALVRAVVNVNLSALAEKEKVVLALSVYDENGNIKEYLSMSGNYFDLPQGKWREMYVFSPVSLVNPYDGKLRAYVWYTGKGDIFIDDLRLEYLPVDY